MTAIKRVLLAADAPDLSGVSFVARHLAAGLRRRQVEVRVWFHRMGPRLADFAEHGLAASVHPGYGLSWIGRQSAAGARAFAPDVVHAQTIDVARRARRLARLAKAPLVITAHHLDPQEGQRLARFPEAGVAAVSDAIRERLTNQSGLARDRIRVIPNALDLSLYPRPPFTIDSDDQKSIPLIGTCGRLVEGKGQRIFLAMAARLAAAGVDAEYLVVGEGPERRALDSYAWSLGIRDRVTFTPLTDPYCIGRMDVLVEPSVIEGLGLSILQAMAMGVPVVASGAGGVFSLVDDGATGLLTPPGDADALAVAVKRLLDAPEARVELARQARDRVEERFDVARIAAQALAFYAERREQINRNS